MLNSGLKLLYDTQKSKLLFIITFIEPLYIIMEFVANGNLQQYLRDQRGDAEYSNIHDASSLSTKGLIIFSLHVVSGMEYISSLGVCNLLAYYKTVYVILNVNFLYNYIFAHSTI